MIVKHPGTYLPGLGPRRAVHRGPCRSWAGRACRWVLRSVVSAPRRPPPVAAAAGAGPDHRPSGRP